MPVKRKRTKKELENRIHGIIAVLNDFHTRIIKLEEYVEKTNNIGEGSISGSTTSTGSGDTEDTNTNNTNTTEEGSNNR